MRLSDPTQRAVVEDEALSQGRTLMWGWLTRYASRADDDAAADANDANDAVVDANADDADADADADDANDADADANDADADADADDANDADADQEPIKSNYKGAEMREGLLLIQQPGRYWALTSVGWARRVEGDEWEWIGAVTVRRTGPVRTLAKLAEKGPGSGYLVSEPSKVVELLHRFTPRRVLVASSAWLEHVGPKP